MDHRSAVKDAKGLEHRFLKFCKGHLPEQSGIILAVSGGVDSVVLLHLFLKWRRALKLELALAHIHHGPAAAKQFKFRDQCREFTARLAAENDLLWFTNQAKPKVRLKSEAALRDFRRGHLLEWQAQWGQTKQAPVWIATAHTADDLLETRLLRLIRGTGPEGLCAIRPSEPPWLRPLLGEAKSTLTAYARSRRLRWLEDPSNRDVDPLRNWVRQKWLKALSRRAPSGPIQISRSLGLIVEELTGKDSNMESLAGEQGLSRTGLLALSRPDQRRVLAQYFRHAGLRDYTQGHIEELLKRLDTGRRELTFTLLGRQWRVNSHWICVQSH